MKKKKALVIISKGYGLNVSHPNLLARNTVYKFMLMLFAGRSIKFRICENESEGSWWHRWFPIKEEDRAEQAWLMRITM